MRRRTALLFASFAASVPAAAEGTQPSVPAGSPAPAFAGPAAVPVEALAAAVGAWLVAAFDLPPAPLPEIRFTPLDAMAGIYRGAEAASGGGRSVAALYDRRARTIHLPNGWTGASAAEISMLVHEMVHHLQQAAGHRPGCPAEAEALAYAAQARWLEHFGRDLAKEFAIDPCTSSCSPVAASRTARRPSDRLRRRLLYRVITDG